MKNSLTGIIAAIAGAASYGLNPLFALPLYERRFQVFHVLGYSSLVAALLLGGAIKIRREKLLPENKKEFIALISGGISMFCCACTLFQSYRMIDSGLASTVLFIYPVIVAAVMTIFFREKLTLPVILGILFTIAGVAILSGSEGKMPFNWGGFLLALTSALFYALYMILLRVSPLKNIPAEKVSFYTNWSNALIYLAIAAVLKDFRMPHTYLEAGCFAGLVFFPGIAALMFMAVAIRQIGATKTAIFGGFEPLTAVFCGIVVFGEKFTLNIAFGVLLVIAGAGLVICKTQSTQTLAEKEY